MAVSIRALSDPAVTLVPGFEAAGVAAGIKQAGKLDLAVVRSLTPCTGAAVFTTNLFKAAPVIYDQQAILANPSGKRGVVINSGCANACTGQQGLEDAQAMAAAAAHLLGGEAQDYMVMSTGVIGQPLPMAQVLEGIRQAAGSLGDDAEAGHRAARAIMTTDTVPKEVGVVVDMDGVRFTIAGMAKGAGMISPNMATLLVTLTSDARIAPIPARAALLHAVGESLNMITVDGDMSTNDTAVLLANGTALMPEITDTESPLYAAFCEGLEAVTVALARALVMDGEGATRFVEIRVTGVEDAAAAKQVAMSVAKSSLVKTAIYGQDANWGRIVCAVGYAGVPLDPARVRVWLGDLELVRDGGPYQVDEERASQILAQREIPIHIDLGQGEASATVWTSDLSHAYVDINAHYRT
ncbi:MAG: bifunctional glutamate N-acetyltransferase/amino-acid acetyltransferase ArgJ [Anaerolineae bacterium]|jgi:glutamate N-acetyltransferase/amino-acid N-acetyltransferase|nr:bifunctional glutamate N-acetyltransferase/amino-acid acetyltransferase ArgJ [Chloroflexota bacterium]